MSIERKATIGVNLVDLLKIPPYKRSNLEIESICRFMANFKFFQDMTEKEDSVKLQNDCCRVLTVGSFAQNEYICKRGDEGDSFYLIIKGKVVIISENEYSLYENNLTAFKDSDPNEKESESRNLTPRSNKSRTEGKETEIAVLGIGQSFGEMALINDKPRYFSVKTVEPCILAILNKVDYHSIAKVHEKQIIEKIEFIRNMDAFKNWTKIAVQKLSYFFKSQSYRKGNVVYKESDPASDIYIIKEGEFVFTQKFEVKAGEKNEGDSFGKLTKKVTKILFRKKQLKIVVKQKGEIFGYNEIMEGLGVREFTCTCLSPTGELLIITDKNFAKKIFRPETIKFIEDSCNGLKGWTKKRIETLRETEVVKDTLSYTPFNKIKVRRVQAGTPDVRLPLLHSPAPYKEAQPTIIDKFLRHSRQKSLNVKKNYSYGVVFQTEIGSSRDKMNNSFGSYI